MDSLNEPAQRLRPRGSNHVGMRQFNERVVLQSIRLNGSLPKAGIARLTKLTPQTVQVIIARLEADDLVRKLEPLRGKVGQPSVPMALNPDGAFSIGIKIGRRGMDLLLLDFTGQVRARLSLDYAFPDPDTLFAEIETRLRQLTHALPARRGHCGAVVARRLAERAGGGPGAGHEVGRRRHPRTRERDDGTAGRVRERHGGCVRG
jgi:hypothetical protein